MQKKLKVRVTVAQYVTSETWWGEKGLGMQDLEGLTKDMGLYSEKLWVPMGFMQENDMV